MKSVSVFCGSSMGSDPKFKEAAYTLGKSIADKGINLVYGGAKIGLMGVVADAALENGGRVIGVLPTVLNEREMAHTGLSELILCETMHERKTKMFELSEGFIALPGGFGTLEEISEILTWQQIGMHKFPVGLLNVDGYYNHLEQLFDHMEKQGLLTPENRKAAIFKNDVETLFKAMYVHRDLAQKGTFE